VRAAQGTRLGVETRGSKGRIGQDEMRVDGVKGVTCMSQSRSLDTAIKGEASRRGKEEDRPERTFPPSSHDGCSKDDLDKGSNIISIHAYMAHHRLG
jgi:hypothetical protein